MLDPEDVVEPDGLIEQDVGGWSELKYKLIRLYSNLFATGMKYKWDQRVFLDIYSGPGISRIRGTDKLVLGSPLIGVTSKTPYDRYIFCDEKSENIEALKARMTRIAPETKADFVVGDSNDEVQQISKLIPKGSSQNTVLSLCIVDPYDISVKFSTIEALAQGRFIDFLVLLAVYMDANRNYNNYVKPTNAKVENFLGSPNWRVDWQSQTNAHVDFPDFLAIEFSRKMATLGYLEQPLHKMNTVLSDEKNLSLYRLALFSRHSLAYKYWDEVLEYSTNHRRLFE
jgi:three-Cys-motif partner protein